MLEKKEMDSTTNFVIFCCFLLFLISIRIVYVLYIVHKRNLSKFHEVLKRDNDVKTMIIIGSGGHTAEMVRMVTSLSGRYSPRHYVIAKSDVMSRSKVEAMEAEHIDKMHCIHEIPRSREVGQSYVTSVLSTIYSTLYSLPLVLTIRPELVLTNGPGTCIPLCAAAFLLKVLCIRDCRIVFVESICRVESLSLTGKLLYHVADHLLVQWPQLAVKYPRTRFIGRIV